MIRAYADLAALYSTLALTEKALEINARVIRMAAREDSMALCGAYRVRSSFLWIWNRLIRLLFIWVKREKWRNGWEREV